MSSAAPEDLTARARIRDAALALFAERGIDGATIRDIAARADVSSGLVRHHFGSKEALRAYCDTYATDRMNSLREQLLAEGQLGDTALLTSVHPTVMLMQNYLVRSIMDGSAAAEAMFEDWVGVAEDWAARQSIVPTDPRAFAAVLVAMQMGVFLMRDQLSRVLGVDVGTPQGHARMTRGFVDAFSHPLLNPVQVDQARAALDRLEVPPDAQIGSRRTKRNSAR